MSGLEFSPEYVPDVTSYDYDAPLTEAGGYTAKYHAARDMIAAYDPLYGLLSHPELPPEPQTTRYNAVTFTEFIPYWNIIENVPEEARETRTQPTAMEQLDINGGNGQSYGHIVYRKEVALRPGSRLTVRGHPRDLVHLMVNGVMLNEPIYNLADLGRNFGSWALRDAEFEFTEGVAECEAGHRHD